MWLTLAVIGLRSTFVQLSLQKGDGQWSSSQNVMHPIQNVSPHLATCGSVNDKFDIWVQDR